MTDVYLLCHSCFSLCFLFPSQVGLVALLSFEPSLSELFHYMDRGLSWLKTAAALYSSPVILPHAGEASGSALDKHANFS